MPLVMAGYFQRCFYGQGTHIPDGREMSGHVTYYDCLLFCLIVRNLDLQHPIIDTTPVRQLYLNGVVHRGLRKLHTSGVFWAQERGEPAMWNMTKWALSAHAARNDEVTGSLILLLFDLWRRDDARYLWHQSESDPLKDLVMQQFPNVPYRTINAVLRVANVLQHNIAHVRDSEDAIVVYQIIAFVQEYKEEKLKRMKLDELFLPAYLTQPGRKASRRSRHEHHLRKGIQELKDLRRMLDKVAQERREFALHEYQVSQIGLENARTSFKGSVAGQVTDVSRPLIENVAADSTASGDTTRLTSIVDDGGSTALPLDVQLLLPKVSCTVILEQVYDQA